MKKIRTSLMLQLVKNNLINSFKRSRIPSQLRKVADDPRQSPEYKRQVKFLEENNIDKPYDCLQCKSFDIEIDVCNTPYAYLYCANQRRDRMCPGFNPPEKGKFVAGLRKLKE